MKTVQRRTMILALFSAIVISGATQFSSVVAQQADHEAADSKWEILFNGKDLNNWIQRNGTAKYRIVEGTIEGTTNDGSPNSFLCTKKEYADFELVFDVRVDNKLNSGVQIRSKSKPNGNERVFGPQVEIEASGKNGAEAGYIYGEATGRGWLIPKKELIPHKHFRDGQWNSYRIIAKGPRIQTWINGNSVADLTDEQIYQEHKSGFIGLQVHSIPKNQGPYSVQWRNLRIREIK